MFTIFCESRKLIEHKKLKKLNLGGISEKKYFSNSDAAKGKFLVTAIFKSHSGSGTYNGDFVTGLDFGHALPNALDYTSE